MKKVKKNWTFQDYRELYEFADFCLGNLIFQKPTKSKLMKIHHKLLYVDAILLWTQLAISTFNPANDLLTFVTSGYFLVIETLGIIFNLAIILNKQKIIDTLNFIAMLPDRQPYFATEKFSESIFSIRKYSVFFIKMLLIWIYVSLSILMLALLCLNYFYMKKKYPLPFPGYLLGIEELNLVLYILNFVHQIYAYYICASFLLYMALIFYGFIVHAWAHLHGIKILIDNLGEGVEMGSYILWIKAISVELYQLKSHFKIFGNDILRWPLYIAEKAAFMGTILVILAVNVAPGLLPWTIGALNLIVSMFIFMVANEFILNGFDELVEALYDTAWYELPPKQRRLLVPLFANCQASICFKVGLRDATIETFADIIKSGYSVALPIQKLIKKVD